MRSTKVTAALCSALACLAAAGAVGCDFPADPEGTLDRVRGGTLRVGVVENEPWVVLEPGADPAGVEPELVRRFAERLDADIEWFEGSERELAAAIRGFELDLVIGGLTRSWPYATHAALTRPYVDTEVELGVPPGTDVPDSLGGLEIWVERGSEAAALLRQEEDDAEPVYFDRLGEVDGAALLDTYEIAAIGYERTDYILRDDEHAMAVPSGENAFLVELEKFLLDRGEEAEDLLFREAAR
ncbi:MAG TPA: transporter substrate-binding domain-containing protein [Solirubrobacterales bacterium]|jgi:polar amino acid transport system substrate-binding protein